MKTILRFLVLSAVCAAAVVPSASAQISVPSDGSDGALIITNNTLIDLAKAVTTNWDANNSGNMGNGVYDPSLWAVVFKYASVSISADATVTFTNHPSRAPVVWLVSGDVTIDGAVSLDGQGNLRAPALPEPGPGGFRGGSGYYSAGAISSPGFGPGGGQQRGTEFFGGGRGAGELRIAGGGRLGDVRESFADSVAGRVRGRGP